MAKIHKVELFLVDVCDDFSDISAILDYLRNSKYAPNIHKIKAQTKEFEWSDDVSINKIDCDTEGYNNFFNSL